MTDRDRDIARLKEQYARQTARWNALKTAFAALPQGTLRIAVERLEELAALGAGARRIRPLPKFGVRV